MLAAISEPGSSKDGGVLVESSELDSGEREDGDREEGDRDVGERDVGEREGGEKERLETGGIGGRGSAAAAETEAAADDCGSAVDAAIAPAWGESATGVAASAGFAAAGSGGG
jgi:hypothetical protein